jgi:hypothetical protein
MEWNKPLKIWKKIPAWNGRTRFKGWSELVATNAPVEDEPVQPVLQMNILPARGVFFFTSSLPHLPPPSYPPSYLPPPTYHLRTPPPLTPSLELELWSGSSSCGAIAVERELEQLESERDPRAHETHTPTMRCFQI